MSNIEKKFVAFLSDSEFSQEEINDLYKSLSRDIDYFFKKAYKIREIMSEKPAKNKSSSISSNLPVYEQKVLSEVDLILRKEARMTVKDAINALASVLKVTPPSSMKSFQDQVLFMVEKKGGSAVINAAYEATGFDSQKEGSTHWPLRDFDKNERT